MAKPLAKIALFPFMPLDFPVTKHGSDAFFEKKWKSACTIDAHVLIFALALGKTPRHLSLTKWYGSSVGRAQD
jgi:hypothetical protein